MQEVEIGVVRKRIEVCPLVLDCGHYILGQGDK